jgi:CheY-like chemotaxis protein
LVEGYELRVARNGKEALDVLQILVPDAIILDLMMPEIDGFEVLKSIRSHDETSKVPVLILSAKHVTKEELSFLKGNHIYQLVQKGDINRLELLAHISEMINQTEPKILKKNTIEAEISSEKGKTAILLIEDNLDNITTIKALIDGKYELLCAADGLSGLEIAKNKAPNLILLDISLPVMDGINVLQEIKKDKHTKDIPVMALTSRAMKGDRELFLEHGFDDYISKPIDSVMFEKIIVKWINTGNG